jgi:hypothetical protein
MNAREKQELLKTIRTQINNGNYSHPDVVVISASEL